MEVCVPINCSEGFVILSKSLLSAESGKRLGKSPGIVSQFCLGGDEGQIVFQINLLTNKVNLFQPDDKILQIIENNLNFFIRNSEE